jgi:hypothetical protein
MGHQLVEPVDGVVGDSVKHVAESGKRLDAAPFAGSDEASQHRRRLAVAVATEDVQLPRPSAMSRLARSVAPLSISISPSSRKRVSAVH